MTQLRALALIGALTVSGCAFKESESERQARQAAALDGSLRSVRAFVVGESEPFFDSGVRVEAEKTRYGLEWGPLSVVSLPVRVPDKIFLDLEWVETPEALQGIQVRGTATSGEDIQEKEVSAQIEEIRPSEQRVVTRIRIEGFHQLFRGDREQRVYLNLELKRVAVPVKRVKLLTSTPPSRLTVVERREIASEADLSGIPERLYLLKSQAETRVLRQFLRLRNDSFAPVRLTIPMRNAATLHARGIRYSVEKEPHPNSHAERHIQKEKEEKFDQPGQFYLYPLSERLPEVWTGLTQRELSLLVVQPGQTIELGLYIAGETLEALRVLPSSRPEMKPYAIDASARCPGERVAPLPAAGWNGGAQYCDLFTGGKNGWSFPSDTVQVCKDAIPTMRACIESGFSSRDLCNRAAILDDELDQRRVPHPDAGIPWQIWFSCRKRIPTPDGQRTVRWEVGWNWEPVMALFKEGLFTEPVVAHWETGMIPVLTRFDDRADPIEAPARELELVAAEYRLRN